MSSFLRLTRACLRRRVRSGHNRTSHRKAMALILSARFFLSNQRHCRWLVAGKDGGERGGWVTFDAYRFCIQARSGYDRTHIAPTHFTRALLRAARHFGIKSDSSCSFLGAENPYCQQNLSGSTDSHWTFNPRGKDPGKPKAQPNRNPA